MYSIWSRAAFVGAILGAIVGGFMMYVAWQHNPQGTFHDLDGVHWLSWLAIGISWFVPVFVVVIGAIAAVWLLQERIH